MSKTNSAIYIFLPTITKGNYYKLIKQNLANILNEFKIFGIVISNISQLELFKHIPNHLDFVANYSLNIFNDFSMNSLYNFNFSKVILSPELSKETINSINPIINKELIVYGRTLLMTSEYCPIGSIVGNYPNCSAPCKFDNYKLKDRLGFEFPIISDNIDCTSNIYNSKIISIKHNNINCSSIRLDFMDESIEEMNHIILCHKQDNRLDGKDYTNGNLNKEI